MLVCGSSASASSTFLGALASSGSPGDRVVVVQEEDEISVSHAQVLRLHGAHKNDDASLRTELETLRNQLIESSSHAIQSGRDRFSSPA